MNNATNAIVVIVTSTIDGQFEETFTEEKKARRFIREELLWESTVRVQCAALNIDERGSMAAAYDGSARGGEGYGR